jgi:hypothetical protein
MNVTVSRLCVTALLLSALCGCSESTILVEISETEFRNKYIEVLDKQELEYTVDDRNIIHVKAKSYDALQARMKEYRDWSDARHKEAGVKVLTTP